MDEPRPRYSEQPSSQEQSRYSGRLKLGEQIKCKIIPKLNRMKVAKEEFSKTTSHNLDSIDYYYDALIGHIEQQKMKDRQEYSHMCKNLRLEPEQYEQQLGSALGTIDYLLKHPQGIDH
jgi:hypothetical protein